MATAAATAVGIGKNELDTSTLAPASDASLISKNPGQSSSSVVGDVGELVEEHDNVRKLEVLVRHMISPTKFIVQPLESMNAGSGVDKLEFGVKLGEQWDGIRPFSKDLGMPEQFMHVILKDSTGAGDSGQKPLGKRGLITHLPTPKSKDTYRIFLYDEGTISTAKMEEIKPLIHHGDLEPETFMLTVAGVRPLKKIGKLCYATSVWSKDASEFVKTLVDGSMDGFVLAVIYTQFGDVDVYGDILFKKGGDTLSEMLAEKEYGRMHQDLIDHQICGPSKYVTIPLFEEEEEESDSDSELHPVERDEVDPSAFGDEGAAAEGGSGVAPEVHVSKGHPPPESDYEDDEEYFTFLRIMGVRGTLN